MARGPLSTLTRNLLALPRELFFSIFRHGMPTSERTRSETIVSNVFLHIHPAKVHPNSLRWNYTLGLGVMAISLFVILIITGVLLMIYYVPSVDDAYDRVKDLSYTVTGGQFVRNMHRWAAHGMVFVVLLHMARVFYTGAYKGARKFNWVVGVILLILTLGLSFSGYLLPNDQLAFWATTIGANIAGSLTEFQDAIKDVFGLDFGIDFGAIQRQLLLGGDEVGQDALLRFYVLHVVVLPVILVLFLAVHMFRVRKDGGLSREGEPEEMAVVGEQAYPNVDTNKTYGLMELAHGKTNQVDIDHDETVSSWPHLMVAEGAVFAFTLVVMIVVSILFNAPLRELANPNVPENPAKAPWYFLGLQELVSYSAFMGGIGIPSLVVVWLFSIPYLDKERAHVGRWFGDGSCKKVVGFSTLYGLATVLGILWVSIKYGWLKQWYPDAEIRQFWIILFNPGTVLVVLFGIWHTIVLLMTRSTRKALLAGFTLFAVGFIILTILATFFRGENWAFYWFGEHGPTHWLH